MPRLKLRNALTTPLAQVVLLAGLAVPYLVNLGGPSLWDANEAFYAETPREMLESGNYLAPTFNFQARPPKPPLTYWAVLASYHLLGVNELSVRIPGAIASAGTLVFVFALGRVLYSWRAGMLAAAVCCTTPRFLVLARKLPIDALLLFCLTATAYFIVYATKAKSRRAWYAAYVFAGLGFMTKGPIALVIPAGAYLGWSLLAGRMNLRECRPLRGAALIALVVLPWYIVIYLADGWTYIAGFFLRDNLGRYAAESFGPSRGLFYYLPAYAGDFFPWSVLSVAAFAVLWVERKQLRPLQRIATGFPISWSVLVFVFFSLSRNKQEYYIASVYPLLSVLLAGVLTEMCGAERAVITRGVRIAWAAAGAAIALALAGVAAVAFFMIHVLLPEAGPALHYSASAVFAATAIALSWFLIRGKIVRSVVALAAGLWAAFLVACVLYLPAVEPFRPVKDMCVEIARQLSPEDAAGYYRVTVPSMVYYLRRPIFEEFDPDAMVRRFQSQKRVFCLLTEQDHNYFVGSRDQILYILDRRPRLVTRLRGVLDESGWAEQELLLVSNRPPRAGAMAGAGPAQ